MSLVHTVGFAGLPVPGPAPATRAKKFLAVDMIRVNNEGENYTQKIHVKG
jgi:hypothetical protein